MREAIADGVCRSPRITLLDNQKVKLIEELATENTVRLFPSIAKLLVGSPVTYEKLLRHDEMIDQLLRLGCARLDELRQSKPDAAGLVVATDIEHAHHIAKALKRRGEACWVVTNESPNAQQVINAFRHSNCRWIVAVGMISEGTDIPRLQVCCYLSRIRTELHYRQVLGRVLRRTSKVDEQAWLFMLAEPTLRSYAERIAEDLPDDLAVLNQLELKATSIEVPSALDTNVSEAEEKANHKLNSSDCKLGFELVAASEGPTYQISFSRHYREQLLACF